MRLIQESGSGSMSSVEVTKRRKAKHTSSFIMFSKEAYHQLPDGLTFLEKRKMLGKKWREMEVHEKEKYIRAAEDKRSTGNAVAKLLASNRSLSGSSSSVRVCVIPRLQFCYFG